MRDASAPWSLARRLGFRWALLFVFFQFGLPAPLDRLPGLSETLTDAWGWLAVRLGQGLGLEVVPHPPTGSGDGLQDWLATLAMAAAAALGALGWSALQRRPVSHPRLADVLQLYVRLVLAQLLFSYGVIKLFGGQFPAPADDRLASTYGESSPMGLMWTFMGASRGYQFFAGALETAAALLLLSRRTTTLGALLACGVMGNVFLLNLSYDVPVKLLSGELLALSAGLAALDGRRLVQVLVLNRAAAPADLGPRWWASRPWRQLRGAAFLGMALFAAYDAVPAGPDRGGPPGAVGVYRVEASQPPLGLSRLGLTDFSARAWFEDQPALRLKVEWADGGQRVVLAPRPAEPGATADLTLAPLGGDRYRLEGTWNDAGVTLEARKLDLSRSLLRTRGFHWVSEAPFNR